MADTDIDDRDLEILRCLQTDARLSNVELAGKVNLSASPCLRRTRRLEQTGVVQGYRAMIDRTRVDLGLTVFVSIKVAGHTRANADALGEALLDIPEVVACHMVSGEADFLAEVVVRDIAAYEALLTDRLMCLPMVADIRSNFALRSLKQNGGLPLGPSRQPSAS